MNKRKFFFLKLLKEFSVDRDQLKSAISDLDSDKYLKSFDIVD